MKKDRRPESSTQFACACGRTFKSHRGRASHQWRCRVHNGVDPKPKTS